MVSPKSKLPSSISSSFRMSSSQVASPASWLSAIMKPLCLGRGRWASEIVGTSANPAALAASSRAWPARISSSVPSTIGAVKPKVSMALVSLAIWSRVWTRALRAFGLRSLRGR